MCDECNEWVHIKCIGITAQEYAELVCGKRCTIICRKCSLPTFSDSFYEDIENYGDQNSFSSLTDTGLKVVMR